MVDDFVFLDTSESQSAFPSQMGMLHEMAPNGMRFAFSRDTARTIYERAGGVSEVSGKKGRMHAMHLDHTRNESYDEPQRGVLVTDAEHIAYHEFYACHPEDIGLERWQNDRGLDLLRGRIRYYHSPHFQEQLRQARLLWQDLLCPSK